MNMFQPGLYRGEVVHTRVRPVQHNLRYQVFSMLVDIDRLDGLAAKLKLFSANRPGLISIHEKDHGDGGSLRAWLDQKAAGQNLKGKIRRYCMLAYPRIFGFVFNPITVFYGLDENDQPLLMIYEVNNTFGQSQTYVLPVDDPREDGLIDQTCDKQLYVSPFNDVEGQYSFHVTPAGEQVTVGVALKTGEGPLLRAHFRGDHHPITDRELFKALVSFGWMTVNVVASIHWEAVKLWVKGLRLKPNPHIADRTRPADKPKSLTRAG